jgi:large subunit ribosomal protein L25
MKTLSLSGSLRENVGKKGAAELRRQERVPAVIYGGEKQTHFSLSYNDAKKLIVTANVFVVELEVNGKKTKAIVQEVQLHPVTDRPVHLDFLEISDTKPFKIKLPVRLEGFSRGVRNGGNLRQNFKKLNVFGLEKDMPEAIIIDITELKIGHKKRVADIASSGLTFLDPENAVVVGVLMARAVIEDEEEEEIEGEEGASAEGEGTATESSEAKSE